MTTVNVKVSVVVDGVEHCPPPATASPLVWTVGPVSDQPHNPGPPTGEPPMQILKATQQVPIQVTAEDAKGNPAAVENVVYTSSTPAVATVEQDKADPTKALVRAQAPGTTQVNVTCDGDLGEGVKTLTGLLDVTVQPGDAVTVSISTGTPVEQPVVNPL